MRGRMALVDDPRTWRNYETMRHAMTFFRNYQAAFMVLPDDPIDKLARGLAALQAECGPIAVFMAAPLRPDGLAARDERSETARVRMEQAQWRRQIESLTWGGGGWSSPEAIIRAAYRHGLVQTADEFDPEDVMSPNAGGERRRIGHIELELSAAEVERRQAAWWQFWGR
jgi:hypothetical protein